MPHKRLTLYLTHRREIKSDDETSVAALTAVVSGVVSSSLSFGEFMGPLVGGALTEVLPFTTSAVVFGEVVLAEVCMHSRQKRYLWRIWLFKAHEYTRQFLLLLSEKRCGLYRTAASLNQPACSCRLYFCWGSLS